MSDKHRKISTLDAYKAMFKFLEAYYERGQRRSDDIGALLGSMQLDSDQKPFDMALESDWARAIEQVIGTSD